MKLEKTNIGVVHDPMPAVLTIAQVAERWSVKYDLPADIRYPLAYHRRGLKFCIWNDKTGTFDNYAREPLTKKVSKKAGAAGLKDDEKRRKDDEKRLTEYESKNLWVRKNDLLNFESIVACIELTADYLRDKIPAPLFGEGFSDEARKVTRLTAWLKFKTWTPIEAAMLVCGLCPPPDCNQVIPDRANGLEGAWVTDENDARFNDARSVLKSWNREDNPPPKVKPADFVAWCKTEKINTDWLRDIAKPQGRPVKAGEPVPGDHWTVKARAIADELFDRDTGLGCRNSLKGYSKQVMELMQERGIKGPRGIIDNANHVMREALQGKKWWQNKPK